MALFLMNVPEGVVGSWASNSPQNGIRRRDVLPFVRWQSRQGKGAVKNDGEWRVACMASWRNRGFALSIKK
ncbi:hypothetical protein [Azospirillum sp.]|uniref:hypothetical protein n=1 Tax=Azospirillum sp. TaxID=34012 RepID=UPI0026183ADB|nr:hypothetical protein [Azospirillum sp.]